MKKKLIGLIGIVLTALVLSSQIAPFEVKANTEIEYAMATDSDFSGTTDGEFRYIGTDEYVEIPHNIKGVDVTSYYMMFYRTSVKGVKSTNKNVTNMRYMFWGSEATELDVSNLDTSSVTNMQQMFRDSQATSLDLSSFDTSSVTNMSQMFMNSQATELDVSSFDTSNITNMSGMFSYSQATSLDLSSFDTSSVTDMGTMFYKSQATALDLSNFDTSSVTGMGAMFYESQAKSLGLGSFDTSNVTNMYQMFYGSQATKLDLSNFDTSSVTSMRNMFYRSQAKELDLSNFDTSSVTSMWGMFQGSRATSLDLSNFDTSNVTSMYHMFRDSKATTLDVSNFDTSSVTNMNQMFRDSQATKLDLSNFDTSKVTDMRYMFVGSQATELDLSSFDMSKVTDMLSMFSGANATIGYAKTKQEVDILNATTNKPARLLFVVKPITRSNEVDVTILPGEFSLTTPEISNGFGSVVLEADVQTLNASFGAPFTVKDLRGTQEGWRLDVQADQLTNGEHTLPASSLTIKPVTDIVRVGSGSGDLPISSQTAVQPIDAGYAVGLVSAPTGGGMGVFDITLPADALAATIDATTTRTDDGGVYKTTLNWSLVQAP